MTEGYVDPASTDLIEHLWRESWGIPVVSVHRTYLPADVEALVWRDEDGAERGLVTWAIDGESAEIVSLDALVEGQHIGGRLLDAAEAELTAGGVRRLTIVTTNDNLRALAFYARRGYRLVRLHLDAMDRVRAVKPEVPRTGHDGIPLRDMWELEKEISPSGGRILPPTSQAHTLTPMSGGATAFVRNATPLL